MAECMRLQLGSAHYTPCRLQHVCSAEAAGVNSTVVWNVCSSPMGVSALRSTATAENGVVCVPVLPDTNGEMREGGLVYPEGTLCVVSYKTQ